MAIKKVAVIGHFGFGETLLNGQTIKTKIITEQLDETFGENRVLKIDTRGGASALVRLPFDVLKALKNCENIVILPAQNGLRVIAPLLVILNAFFKRKLHYAVIGGWLASFIDNKKALTKALKKFNGIYVETNTMKKDLEAMRFENVIVMPNCKQLTILSQDELIYSKTEPYKLCTFSRIMREKGIEDAIKAIKTANEKYGKTIYTLDIYGQIDAGQTEWFSELQKSFPEYVKYGGLVPFDKSVEVLKSYFALLFPTYYEGEGFAGTIIDAFASGVPVIASDWKYNTETVENDTTGRVFTTHETDQLTSVLIEIYNDVEGWNALKTNCIKKAEEYTPKKAISKLIDNLK